MSDKSFPTLQPAMTILVCCTRVQSHRWYQRSSTTDANPSSERQVELGGEMLGVGKMAHQHRSNFVLTVVRQGPGSRGTTMNVAVCTRTDASNLIQCVWLTGFTVQHRSEPTH